MMTALALSVLLAAPMPPIETEPAYFKVIVDEPNVSLYVDDEPITASRLYVVNVPAALPTPVLYGTAVYTDENGDEETLDFDIEIETGYLVTVTLRLAPSFNPGLIARR